MCQVHSMMDIAPTVSMVLGLSVPSAAKGTPITEMVDGLQGASRIALLVPDALGWYAWRLWHREMPFLDAQRWRPTIGSRTGSLRLLESSDQLLSSPS